MWLLGTLWLFGLIALWVVIARALLRLALRVGDVEVLNELSKGDE